jgi:hypothetical protein
MQATDTTREAAEGSQAAEKDTGSHATNVGQSATVAGLFWDPVRHRE